MKNILKSRIFYFVLGAIIFTTVGAYAATLLASEIPYTNNDQENVQSAIDDLYNKAENHCPYGKYCTEKMLCINNKNIETTKKCKRAETLHMETCNQVDETYYCSGAGYKNKDTIVYGKCGTSGTLASGDAFDCDVNGDGYFDSETERFYYISKYFNTETKQFEDGTAVLIYYSNVNGGLPNNSSAVAYNSANKNYEGPQTAKLQLPTTLQWSNINLKNMTRAILNSGGGNKTGYHSNKDNLNTLTSSYSYEGYAARLLTIQEANVACNVNVGQNSKLNNCLYLLENTNYSNENYLEGYWFETASDNYSAGAFCNGGNNQTVTIWDTNKNDKYGVRPVIEVPISDIEY